MNANLLERLRAVQDRLQAALLRELTSDGHWVGELSASALSTATAVSALAVYQRESDRQQLVSFPEQPLPFFSRSVHWLLTHQNQDGGWGDTPRSNSNISTTVLVLSALRLAESVCKGLLHTASDQLVDGERYVTQVGGHEAVRKRYGEDKTFAVPILMNAALAGRVPWTEVAALPFEFSVIPQSWYRFVQLPVVSYAIPALVAVGQVVHHHRPTRNPVLLALRNLAVAPSLSVLERMQPASGGFLEAIPLTSFVVMSLAASGKSDQSVVERGIQFLKESVREDGSWPIDTNLATWTTTLAVNALDARTIRQHQGDAFEVPTISDCRSSCPWPAKDIHQCWEWILSCQHQVIHPFTGARPGGWGWTDLSGAVPDADDTPGAMLALYRLAKANPHAVDLCRRSEEAARLGAQWLLDLQNRDGGWPTFCRGWGRLPFDRSGTDLTAHVLRALLEWSHVCTSPRCHRAIQRGWRYLESQQNDDGSWTPLWFGNQHHASEENPVYGTAKVLMAYRDAGFYDSRMARRGIRFLLSEQSIDGGWGVQRIAKSSLSSPGEAEIGNCSVEETALAIEALLPARAAAGLANAVNSALERGLEWLLRSIDAGRHLQASPIGLYFAKLWYYEKLYPLTYAVSAVRATVEAADPIPRSPSAADEAVERA